MPEDCIYNNDSPLPEDLEIREPPYHATCTGHHRYAVRITYPDDDPEIVHNFVAQYSAECHFISWEVGSETKKPHAHLYCETSVEAPALRTYLRERLGAGNAFYSVKSMKPLVADIVRYISYLLKDKVRHDTTPENWSWLPFPHRNLSDEFLGICLSHAMHWRATARAKRDGKTSTLVILRKQFQELLEAEPGTCFGIGTTTRRVIKYYKDNQKRISLHLLVSDIQTLCLEFDPTFEGMLAARLTRMIRDID